MRVLVAESANFSARAERRLRSLGDVTMADLDRSRLIRAISDADALFVRLRNRIDAEVLEGATSLRAVVTPTTGLDHVDMSELDRRGIALLSLRGETEFLDSVSATAEHTWALLLALIRHLPAATAAVRSGAWDRDRFRGRELLHKTLGIVGLGRLGSKVARYGAVFGMRVLAFDPYLDDQSYPYFAGDPRFVPERCDSLRVLLEQADVVSLHVPLNDDTRCMLNAEAIHQMKRGAVLVNTSRGAVVDEVALVAAVQSGHLSGAALDVLASETGADGVAGSPALAFASRDERILITPHIGGATVESMENTEVFMVEKFIRWANGKHVRVDAGPKAGRVASPRSRDAS